MFSEIDAVQISVAALHTCITFPQQHSASAFSNCHQQAQLQQVTKVSTVNVQNSKRQVLVACWGYTCWMQVAQA